MRTIILAFALLGVATQTIKPPTMGAHCNMPRPVLLMAQEGNPGHHEPPPGWNCANTAATPADHKCACHRECKDSTTENEDGSQSTSTTVVEDPKCRAYCFKDHCSCGVHNCE